MKKYFILAAAALVTLASCMKNNVETSAPKEISYNAVAAKNTVTKAINDKTYYAPGDPSFGIWGLYQPTDWATDHAANQFWVGTDATTPAHITYVTDTWKNATVNYWPLNGKLVFMGYSPYTDDGSNTVSAAISKTTESTVDFVTLTFTDFSTFAGNFTTDLMWSDAVEKASNDTGYDHDGNDGTDTQYNGVPVVFHHALSQIVVNAATSYDYAGQGYTFTITGLSIIADDIATLTVKDNLSDAPTVSWTEPATDKTATITPTGTALNTSMVAQGPAILLIPQTLTAEQDILRVNYKVVHNGVTSTKSVDINLNGGSNVTLASLAANTKYNLNLTFSLSEIKYSPDVDDWTATSSSNYSVQN